MAEEKSGGGGNFLNRKIGPLKGKVWAVLVGGGAIAALAWRRFRSTPIEDEEYREDDLTDDMILPMATGGYVFPGSALGGQAPSTDIPDNDTDVDPPATPGDVDAIGRDQKCLEIRAALASAEQRSAQLQAKIRNLQSKKKKPKQRIRILRTERQRLVSTIAQYKASLEALGCNES